MSNVYSEVKRVKKEKPFDIVFNEEYVSSISEGDEIEYWGSNFDFIKGRKYRKHYPKKDLFHFDEYSSVAVVGNSGSVIDSGFGEEIDSHECVIRFNTAPIDGYEDDVGSSVDFRVSIGTLNYRSDDEKILRTYRREVQPKRELKRKTFEEDYHFVLTDRFISWVQSLKGRSKKGRNVCSSGFVGVCLSLLISKKVSLYGFNLPTDGSHDYHYHSRVKYTENAHNFESEHEIYSLLEEKKKEFQWIKN